jgi:hypothetical protein
MMDSTLGPVGGDDLAAGASERLEAAAAGDHETRLEVLEGLYRSLETELEAAGSQALQQ